MLAFAVLFVATAASAASVFDQQGITYRPTEVTGRAASAADTREYPQHVDHTVPMKQPAVKSLQLNQSSVVTVRTVTPSSFQHPSHLPLRVHYHPKQLALAQHDQSSLQQLKADSKIPEMPSDSRLRFADQTMPLGVQPMTKFVNQGVALQPQIGVVPPSMIEPKQLQPFESGVMMSDDRAATARIVQQDMEVNPDGSFINVWNSENGISVQEQGTVKHVGDSDVAVQNGEISYVDNEGNTFHLKYIADENGFRVLGDHIPTPPPIPQAIARGLEFIAAHPYVETTTPSLDELQQIHTSEQSPVVLDN